MEFVPVELVPRPGEIVHAAESWSRPRGGGVVAAVQFGELADSVQFFTALGTDERGRRAKVELESAGSRCTHRRSTATAERVHVRRQDRRADDHHDRPEAAPRGHDDSLPWHELARCEAVYFCAGDADALLLARRGRVLVATARELTTLGRAPSSSTPW